MGGAHGRSQRCALGFAARLPVLRKQRALVCFAANLRYSSRRVPPMSVPASNSAAPKPFYRDWFLGGIVLAVALASFAPDLGRSAGVLHLGRFVDYGIAVVFFLHGLGVPTEKLRAGVLQWRLHALVQAFTFVAFPLWGLALGWLFGRWLPPPLLLGFYFLCALPSTVSSSVAFTGAARGNVPAAIFNATLSSLLGVVLTPLIVGFFASTGGGHGLSLHQAIVDIAKLLLLPFVVGQLLHQWAWLRRRFERFKPYTNGLDRGVILLLVLSSFSDSVASGLWTNFGVTTLLVTVVGAALVLALMLSLTTRTARALGMPVADEIVAVFCGSKKSLAAGVPMAKVIFGTSPALGLILLPLMFYHQAQLMVCAALAARYARRDSMNGLQARDA